VTYSALVGTVVLSVLVPFFWVTPAGAWHWLGLAALGMLGGVGHYFVAQAFAAGPASIISPFHYVQLVWASVLGYVVFGEVPGVAMWVGAIVIIGSGLYIALREIQRW
jgi:drug/metabolite transporter (DMT)-like permease